MKGLSRNLSQEGYGLMGAAFEVHTTLGGGMAEAVYQQSLVVELATRGIPFVINPSLAIAYKGRQLSKRFVPDLIVFDKIVVEIKAVSSLCPEHEGQLFNYLRIAQLPVGYLINFGPLDKVEWKRFILSEFLV